MATHDDNDPPPRRPLHPRLVATADLVSLAGGSRERRAVQPAPGGHDADDGPQRRGAADAEHLAAPGVAPPAPGTVRPADARAIAAGAHQSAIGDHATG